MQLDNFLRSYRKNKKLSVRAFAEMLDVNRFRLEKWEIGVKPNYIDGSKIRKYFGVRDYEEFSEYFLKNFDETKKYKGPYDVSILKDQLLEEKDKRIESLEETIRILKEAFAVWEAKEKS